MCPIYEYECPECKLIEEILHKQYVYTEFMCPKCNKRMTRNISSCGFRLRGDGWYKPSSGGKDD